MHSQQNTKNDKNMLNSYAFVGVLHKHNDPVYFPVKNYGNDTVTSSFLVVALLCVATLPDIRNGHINISETRQTLQV